MSENTTPTVPTALAGLAKDRSKHLDLAHESIADAELWLANNLVILEQAAKANPDVPELDEAFRHERQLYLDLHKLALRVQSLALKLSASRQPNR